jgi:hypothetical protein
LSESLHHGKLLFIPWGNRAGMNAHPAPAPPTPSGSLGIWLWLLLAVGVVVLWWLGHAFRR